MSEAGRWFLTFLAVTVFLGFEAMRLPEKPTNEQYGYYGTIVIFWLGLLVMAIWRASQWR